MATAEYLLTALVAVLHLWFLVLEMFLWDKPYGLKIFGHSRKSATASKVLAMNQGLYNGFLATGLIWGMILGEAGESVRIFFLLCVVAAGIFGGLTASRKILYVQALPAAVTLAFVFMN